MRSCADAAPSPPACKAACAKAAFSVKIRRWEARRRRRWLPRLAGHRERLAGRARVREVRQQRARAAQAALHALQQRAHALLAAAVRAVCAAAAAAATAAAAAAGGRRAGAVAAGRGAAHGAAAGRQVQQLLRGAEQVPAYELLRKVHLRARGRAGLADGAPCAAEMGRQACGSQRAGCCACDGDALRS
jgi:hypothetical protein